MKKTDFTQASTHLKDLLGIDLTKHLSFTRKKTLNNYSVIGSLVVVYRYAEALGKKFVVHDMTAGGHQSHQLGTELDFDVASKRKDPVTQVHVISDMLRIRKALRSELDAFRLGIYVDYFYNTDANTFAKYEDMYGGGKTAASMHIGVRYKWSSQEYKGKALPPKAGAFTLWGRGSKGYEKSGLWRRRIESWNIGFLKGACESLATRTIVTDFRALDNNPPPLKPELSLRVAL